MSDADGDGESLSPRSEQSPWGFDRESDLNTPIASTVVGARTRWPLGNDASDPFWMVVTLQAGWMVLMLGALFGIDAWSLERYFILSFLGLLGVRLLFAPTRRTPDWWRVLNWIVYGGFVVLGYVFFRGLDVVAA